MKEQSYEKHVRYPRLQLFFWVPLSFVLLLTTASYGIYQFVKNGFSMQLFLIFAIIILAIIPGMLARIYALTLQDRLICTEEQLRYFMLTGNRLDPRLTKSQLIALRFAPDAEVVALAERAVVEELSADAIKKTIKLWRADHQRV
ncbi:hypothetical protein B481_1460 [Planococcus halocryophilus Or1]|uniref:Uncharacterized protein n=1 Tax=Planococcus halocryophilus TaxID=1215089 RepID=A0A1C7DUQ6_9BACL|nr:DUF6526 family protein [Planococcus halocryophilus]ANU15137.1 hypothetical protein BBI08_15355 [Planococcus halocryophilus]EMF47064.1 hypothetical protein B481_1460 [Planococcus halocryophilus Or1]